MICKEVIKPDALAIIYGKTFEYYGFSTDEKVLFYRLVKIPLFFNLFAEKSGNKLTILINVAHTESPLLKILSMDMMYLILDLYEPINIMTCINTFSENQNIQTIKIQCKYYE